MRSTAHLPAEDRYEQLMNNNFSLGLCLEMDLSSELSQH